MCCYANGDTSEPWVDLFVHPAVYFVHKYLTVELSDGSQELSVLKAFISHCQIIPRNILHFLHWVYFPD